MRTPRGSLPPCGGGVGRGVRKSACRCKHTPLPITLRALNLPRKGGGEDVAGLYR